MIVKGYEKYNSNLLLLEYAQRVQKVKRNTIYKWLTEKCQSHSLILTWQFAE